jgi:hypothetical protein
MSSYKASGDTYRFEADELKIVKVFAMSEDAYNAAKKEADLEFKAAEAEADADFDAGMARAEEDLRNGNYSDENDMAYTKAIDTVSNTHSVAIQEAKEAYATAFVSPENIYDAVIDQSVAYSYVDWELNPPNNYQQFAVPTENLAQVIERLDALDLRYTVEEPRAGVWFNGVWNSSLIAEFDDKWIVYREED